MRTIPLTQGQVAIVDDDDYPELMKFKWCAAWFPDSRSFRAIRGASLPSGRSQVILMHRDIMGAAPGQDVDHANHDPLDNRKANLRICTRSQNSANRRKRSHCSSPYKGVSWRARGRKWQARIHGPEGGTHLGYFKDPIDAARAYDQAARERWGEFAYTNDV